MPKKFYDINALYYKPITIVNDNSSIINKLETSLIDDARVVIYKRHMFIVQPTGSAAVVGSFRGLRQFTFLSLTNNDPISTGKLLCSVLKIRRIASTSAKSSPSIRCPSYKAFSVVMARW
jgi:hypothetical protein